MKKAFWILIAFAALAAGCKKDKQPTGPVLITTAVTNLTANGVTTGGNISADGGSPVTKRGIAWALHTAPTVADSVSNNGTGTGTFTTTLTNLGANTVYYIRAYAINGVATAYGNEISFTTAKGAPTVTTTALGTINLATASAPSGGNVTNDGGASVTARGVCWSTAPHPTTSSSATNDGTGIGTFTSTLTPLASNNVYYYRAYATNSYGTAYGNELTFNAGSTATALDVDGNVYHTITISGKTWMTENLRVTHYQNGDPLINGFNNSSFNWSSPTAGAYTFPNGDTTTKKTYGLLYGFLAIQDSRNIAPVGWHVATDADWEALEFAEGMAASDTSKLGNRGTIGPLLQVGGSSGLNLQLAGAFSAGTFPNFGLRGYFMTTTKYSSTFNWYREIYVSTDANYPIVTRSGNNFTVSVRCVKNN